MSTVDDRVTPAAARAARRLPRTAGFWLLGTTLLAFMGAASAPSPLYVVYQHRWGFSATTLTAVFAVYALALLVALLTVGGLSDFLGRRPVLIAALLAETAAMVVFLTAGDVGTLLAARVVQGLATGAATGAISAGLVDLQPGARLGSLVNSVAPSLGLAAGALGSGALVQYAPAPTTLVFAVLTGVFVVLAAVMAFIPDLVTPRPGALASLRPRAAVPAPARAAFLAVAPCLVATWALGGLYLSLGGSLAAGVLHIGNHLVGGLVVTALTGAGAVVSVLVRDRAPQRVMAAGSAALAAGTAVTLLALGTASTSLFFIGTAIAGCGFGGAFLGAFRSVAALAGTGQRAELFASVYVISYLAFSVPAVVAGIAVPSFGLRATATAYGAVVIALSLIAAVSETVGSRTGRPAAAPAPAAPAPAAPCPVGDRAAG
ncbi:MFS transporter [Actinoallomurus soli]|uniref:MFS transporter n=1 Tax=Actinoallomurus soli TaxID=2952535 RepID=UPI002092FB4C|nr:MFS transporter [Actinoallomurus soli]MCO5972368.1 MFS transporter [Actinoallomurus soli]